MNKFLMLLTAPIWLLQAIYVRKVAIRLPEANKTLFNSHQPSTSPTQFYVLGDSVAAGVGVECISNSLGGQVKLKLSTKLNKEIAWSVHAQSGDKISDLSRKIKLINITEDSFFLISIGVNDVTKFTSIEQWRNDLIKLLDVITQRKLQDSVNNQQKIVVLAIPPIEQFPLIPFPLSTVLGTRAKKLNKETSEIVSNYHRVHFLPLNVEVDPTLFAEDGFHPSSKGCRLLSQPVAEILTDK